MQATISQQLQLDPTTVANFFMNARRRGHDRLLPNRQSLPATGTSTSSITSGSEQSDPLDALLSSALLSNGHAAEEAEDGEPLKLDKLDDCIANVLSMAQDHAGSELAWRS